MQRIPQVWPGWQAEELIGQGAYGKVYRASREVAGHTSVAAIKVIDIPGDESEVRSLRSMGMDAVSIRAYFEETARSVIREVAVMESLKGAPNVVDIDDYQLLEREGGVGWTVLIRMELLEDLASHQAREGLPDAREAARAGVDVCRALQFCHEAGIIHRDVKPENVFVGRFGDYRLGDFGLSRRLDEGSRSTKSQAGSGPYVAPEVLTGHYDARADVYSLGVMLYRWLNGGRPPFVGAGEAPTRASLDAAQLRRLSGERPPAPAGEGVDPALAGIVLRAVEPGPDDRWQSAAEFGEALRSWLDGEHAAPEPEPVPAPLPEPEPAPSPEPAPAPERGGDARAEVTLSASEARAGAVREASYEVPGTGERAVTAVSVPAGSSDGDSLRITGLGGPGSGGGPAGDLVVTVRVLPGPEPAPEPVSEPDRGLALDGPGSAAGVEEEPKQRPLPVLSRRAALALAGGAIATGALWAIQKSIGDAADYSTSDNDGVGPAREALTVVDVTSAQASDYNPFPLTWETAAGHSKAIAAGFFHTVGLRCDGTVVATGWNDAGQCDVSGWSDIIAIAVGEYHTVGLRSDGTVVATGSDFQGECDVSEWTDVVTIAAGDFHTVGLRSDGTVVATASGYRTEDPLEPSSGWSGIASIAASYSHTVGLRSDGTVVAAGNNEFGQCDVSGWSDIIAIAVGNFHTVGLRSDGTVVATGSDFHGERDVSEWTDVVTIMTGSQATYAIKSDGSMVSTAWKHLVAEYSDIVAVSDDNSTIFETLFLLADGTVVSSGYGRSVSAWKGVIAAVTGFNHCACLRSDGSVGAWGDNEYGQCDVSDWSGILVTG